MIKLILISKNVRCMRRVTFSCTPPLVCQSFAFPYLMVRVKQDFGKIVSQCISSEWKLRIMILHIVCLLLIVQFPLFPNVSFLASSQDTKQTTVSMTLRLVVGAYWLLKRNDLILIKEVNFCRLTYL